jgi:hypothetical protein
MAEAVNAAAKRVLTEFTVGSDKFALKQAQSRVTGTLFTLMGYTKVDKLSAGAVELRKDQAVDAGKLVPMVAEGTKGSRRTYTVIYVPTSKLEETVAGAAGKTIGSSITVSSVRGRRRRTFS